MFSHTVLVPVWHEQDVDIPACNWEGNVGREAEKELTDGMGVDFGAGPKSFVSMK